jgi:signal transduction histidine kinase
LSDQPGGVAAGAAEPPIDLVESLRATELFANLDPREIERVAGLGTIERLAPGEALITEGEQADAMFVVLSGSLQVSKRSGASEIMLTRVGPGALQGEVAALEGGRRLASVRAITPAVAFRLPIDALRELLAAGPDIALAIITTAVGRLRGMEASLREMDKLAALGRLAAGVAHELNNPAAAALRSVDELMPALDAMIARSPPASLPAPPPGPVSLSALDRADRIDELTPLAGGEGAAALVDAGWTRDALAGLSPDDVAWLTARARVGDLARTARLAVARISELVEAVKGYAFLDRAPVQRVDVWKGIEQTLVLMRHRLGEGIELVTAVDGDLPEIEAYGGELNQVWTNLIENALDAMGTHGTLTVRARRSADAGGVQVEISDTGPGIAPVVRPHLFEPFFTTKPPGYGAGLGLHITHTVVARHGGHIEVESEPGRTCFLVTLRPLPAPE